MCRFEEDISHAPCPSPTEHRFRSRHHSTTLSSHGIRNRPAQVIVQRRQVSLISPLDPCWPSVSDLTGERSRSRRWRSLPVFRPFARLVCWLSC